LLAGCRENAGPTLRFARWAISAGRVEGIEGYLVAAEHAGMNDFKKPGLFRVAAPPVTYPGERSLGAIKRLDTTQPERMRDTAALAALDAGTFADLVRVIRTRIEPGAGLIIPPYLQHFRDALVDYAIFLQEHHDGNVMMGGPRIAAFFASRMVELTGVDYEGLPSKHSGLMTTFIREGFLRLDADELEHVRDEHPTFRYLVTEPEHELPFRLVARTSALIVYDLRARVDRPTLGAK
jgi:hypothetical protein